MPDRSDDLGVFIREAGWGDAACGPLAGDASNRKYLRLSRANGETAVVMDADPGKGEDVRPFVLIARHLEAAGLSAPKILAKDEGRGFLVLEDLGDAIYARILERDPSQETALYLAAADALAHLHLAPLPPGIAAYDAGTMTDRAALAYEWYARGAGRDSSALRDFRSLMAECLDRLAPGTPVLALRDFHAENLIWLPGRQGVARVGLLDFQDALAGHPAYDLASLLTDARRDVSANLRETTTRHFLDRTGHPAEDFLAASAVLGVQRNLRILGVFARLSMHYGKPGYIRLIPRVWGHLVRDLGHPRLAPLKARVLTDLPEPSSAVLSRLEGLCAAAIP